METPASKKTDCPDPTVLDATAVTVELGHLWSEISKLKKALDEAHSERARYIDCMDDLRATVRVLAGMVTP